MPNIQINGDPKRVEAATVSALLEELGLAGQPVAVERNRDVVPHTDRVATPVADGDRFELVTLVGGG